MALWVVEIAPPSARWPEDWPAPSDWPGCKIIAYRGHAGGDTLLIEADEAAIAQFRDRPGVSSVARAEDGWYVADDGMTYVVSGGGSGWHKLGEVE
jgi:hypothetical protein